MLRSWLLQKLLLSKMAVNTVGARHAAASLFRIHHPIVLAPMANINTPALTAAVSNAGGLGSFGFGTAPTSQLRQQIHDIRSLLSTPSTPFAINLFVPPFTDPPGDPYADPEVAAALRSINNYYDKCRGELGVPKPAASQQTIDLKGAREAFLQQTEVLLEERVPVVSFTFEVPPKELIQVGGCFPGVHACMCAACTFSKPKARSPILPGNKILPSHLIKLMASCIALLQPYLSFILLCTVQRS